VPRKEPDPVGAFRFICQPGQLLYDDPIVYPGQPGKSHLHQFYGNTAANAYSTYESLRTSGDSTCVSTLNRSGYWMPAMLDGKGNVVRPNFVAIYYKRRPASDPKCIARERRSAVRGHLHAAPQRAAHDYRLRSDQSGGEPDRKRLLQLPRPTSTCQASIPTSQPQWQTAPQATCSARSSPSPTAGTARTSTARTIAITSLFRSTEAGAI
jgi:hypothetical protein